MPRPYREKFPLPASLNRWAVRTIANRAHVDPRTVSGYVSGKRTPIPSVKEVLDAVLRDAGHADLIRPDGV